MDLTPASGGSAPRPAADRARRPLSIWAVADGRAGIAGQAQGLAEAVASLTPAKIACKRVGWKAWLDPWPPAMNPGRAGGLSSGSSAFEPPWPDLWIAAGRASLPLSARMRARSGGATFVVQLQNPRTGLAAFDLVAPPRHDELEGPNVFAITGAPHRVTPERLDEAAGRFAGLLAPMPRPRTAVLIGGRSRAFDLAPATARRLGDGLATATRESGGSVLVTFSRRTPAPARAILTAALSPLPGAIWNGEGENPYFAFLAAADAIAVTEDSVNMAAEAASTGTGVYVLPVDGAQRCKRLFHADLESRGAARRFAGALTPFTARPLRETERLAREIVRRMALAAP